MGMISMKIPKTFKKVLLSNLSYRSAYGYDRMPKDLDPRKIVKGASPKDKNSAIYIIKNADQILKNAIEPIENSIHDFTVEMLKGLESLFILDNKKETERIRKEVSNAIKVIEKSGHEGALEILQKQMNKLRVLRISQQQKVCFYHDGWSYKFTGNFAPVNQILVYLSLKKGIHHLKKLMKQLTRKQKKNCFVSGRFRNGQTPCRSIRALQKQYGSDNDISLPQISLPPKSPLDFEEKKEIMLKHGIPDSQIIQAVSPYRIGEIADQFDSEDIIVYAVGKKDMEEVQGSRLGR